MSDEPTIQVRYLDAEGEIAAIRVRTPQEAAKWVIRRIQEVDGLHPGDMFLVAGAAPLELSRDTNTKVAWDSRTDKLQAS